MLRSDCFDVFENPAGYCVRAENLLAFRLMPPPARVQMALGTVHSNLCHFFELFCECVELYLKV